MENACWLTAVVRAARAITPATTTAPVSSTNGALGTRLTTGARRSRTRASCARGTRCSARDAAWGLLTGQSPSFGPVGRGGKLLGRAQLGALRARVGRHLGG